uniref:hypothetical protein n=1 Tax=Pedobacter schmidteae TaxID=2201271 RepID=UPI000EB1EA8E|nr:hypothetical protein [Pedobacter schmidteae]
MKQSKIIMVLLKEEKGFSAQITTRHHFIATEGDDLDDLVGNINKAVNLALEKEVEAAALKI